MRLPARPRVSDPKLGACGPDSTEEQLNRDCFCPGVDPAALHERLEALLHDHGLPATLADSHANLFATLPVFVSRNHLTQMAAVVASIEEVVATAHYRAAALSWAPDIARFDPGSPGGLLGFDFHLEPEGPRLIEINTNPGGALINVLVAQTQQVCMPESMATVSDPGRAESAIVDAMLAEWRLQRGSAPLQFVAIVDESPAAQYLYPEFALYRELLRRHVQHAEICDPIELIRERGRLRWRGHPVDLVYNRLTDFALDDPLHATLREAFLTREVAMSPHPRAHALYADKRNLALLGSAGVLEAAGIGNTAVDVLLDAIPHTRLVTAENRDELWAERRRLFFKPAAGFGSKASYRGDKLTRRVWDEIGAGTYVAQDIVTPSERRAASPADPLKVDIRCYAYRGEPLLYAARMYRGQTTNFRTPGGGFAPVLTSIAAHPPTV